ncbi:RNA 3'-terminal phosphate cyclase [Pseudomonas sp. SWRI18]|uniref:RNA 3'-terminal phosphate cyclase n=1 Tax=Pseudomonas sp. SWRI18 TaxID=2753888 RepID=UPI001647D5A4|nr:RNA 3'-terminal phosphate cyclase [Pseudomonas sp. SWRI18]MBC3301628.1 RNA 3'-terminal phosphate cyclase [Pseudomonas sp. SWRI18]
MQQDVIELDGAIGGGQVLRSGLSLSMVTGRTLSIKNIRARRSRPGLMRQHLTAVLAAAQVCGAKVHGAQLGSQALVFAPGPIQGDDYRFAIGTAGSCTLVLQTVLPALLRAPTASRVTICGGTHNPLAPPVDFLQRAWLPLLRGMGARIELNLNRYGFVPAGGGELEAFIQPSVLSPLQLVQRGNLLESRAITLNAGLPAQVSERQFKRVRQRLPFDAAQCLPVEIDPLQGPGNVLMLEYVHAHVTEVFSAFGLANLRAETVADQAIDQAVAWQGADTAVGEHLADQLLLPMALAGGGRFTTSRMSEHLHSNMRVIQRFLPVVIDSHVREEGGLLIECRAR